MIKKTWENIKKYKKTSIVGLIVLILILMSVFSGGEEIVRETIYVENNYIIQEVSVTGNVKAADEVSLGFEQSGKVGKVNVEVGQVVKERDILATLVGTGSYASLQQAQASAQSSQALVDQYKQALTKQETDLKELKSGPRIESIVVAQTTVSNAEKSAKQAQDNYDAILAKADDDLVQVYDDIDDVLHTAYAKVNDAVRRLTDPLFTKDTSVNPQLTFTTSNSSAKSLAQQMRHKAEIALVELATITSNIPTDELGKINALTSAQVALNTTRDFFNALTTVMNSASGFDAATLATYQNNVSTGMNTTVTQTTAILAQIQLVSTQKNTNQNSITTAQVSLTTAGNTLSAAQENLNLVLAGATAGEIQAQEALVEQARANFRSQQALLSSAWASITQAQAVYNQTIIRAPFTGIITKQDLQVGEIVSAQTEQISMISDVEFEIEAFVPEVDIAKISVDDEALVTLDAYGVDQEFIAKVVSVDPAETVIEGLSTYRVRLRFAEQDERIKSGMTANVDISTDRRDDVLAVPQRALVRKDGKRFIRVVDGAKTHKEVEIETGLRGSDGLIEIISGLIEGDEIVTYIEEK